MELHAGEIGDASDLVRGRSGVTCMHASLLYMSSDVALIVLKCLLSSLLLRTLMSEGCSASSSILGLGAQTAGFQAALAWDACFLSTCLPSLPHAFPPSSGHCVGHTSLCMPLFEMPVTSQGASLTAQTKKSKLILTECMKCPPGMAPESWFVLSPQHEFCALPKRQKECHCGHGWQEC
jgi:hypothetical protein